MFKISHYWIVLINKKVEFNFHSGMMYLKIKKTERNYKKLFRGGRNGNDRTEVGLLI